MLTSYSFNMILHGVELGNINFNVNQIYCKDLHLNLSETQVKKCLLRVGGHRNTFQCYPCKILLLITLIFGKNCTSILLNCFLVAYKTFNII